ncbi:hypothetical protein DFQ27_002540 [Actinomortierella ambigua]|uniref:UBX domain-containing protein n=1 Tax=Actinomortierella ambigua TaxID=1343610 RepID=A0A9P6QA14_9FUNG|nr:hypothetical protein DFQ27_002540 [Actinomortierella ambigua]
MDIDSENIAQFCTITSAEPDVAVKYLTVCDGDLHRAISLYMESGGDALGVAHLTSETARSSSTHHSRQSSSGGSSSSGHGAGYEDDEELARRLQEQDNRAADQVRAPIAPRHEMLLGDDYDGRSSLFAPNSSRSRAQQSVFLPPDSTSLARDAFRDFAAEAALMSGETSPKTSRLADLFKAPRDIMAKGDFEQSRSLARAETKWLMVNIQEAGVFACQVLNRDLWSNDQVKEIIKVNFVFLQFYADNTEGKKYATFYPIKSFPHIAIIDPRTAERVKVWTHTVDPVDFVSDVTEFLDRHSLTEDSSSKPSEPKKKKITKDISDMTEDEQLQAALAASLGSTSSPDNDVGGSEPSRFEGSAEGTSAIVQANEVEEDTEVAESTPEAVFDSIQPVLHDEPNDPASSTRIAFRLNDGGRIMHRFAKDAKVRVLFEYIKAKVEDARDRPFELVFINKQLIDFVEQTLSEVGLENAQVMMQM